MRLKHLHEIVSLATLTVATYLGLGTASWSGSDAPSLSLNNTNFVVSVAFIAFLAILFYLKVPSFALTAATKAALPVPKKVA